MQEKTVNKVILRGYVYKEPQLRYFSETNIKAYFPLLTFDQYRNETEVKRIPEYHTIIAWKENATKVEELIKEKQLIEVIGRLKTHNYEKDGQTKLSIQIILSEFKILEEAPEKESKQYPPSVEDSKLTDMDQDLFEKDDEDVLPF